VEASLGASRGTPGSGVIQGTPGGGGVWLGAVQVRAYPQVDLPVCTHTVTQQHTVTQ